MINIHDLKLPCDPLRIDDFLSEPSPAVVQAASSMAAPVGVLGAGGKMGLHLAVMLRKALDRAERPEVPVYAVSRFGSLRSREEFERFGVQTMAADLLDPVALEALPDMGTVFFLAGIKFGTGSDTATLQRFNEEMPNMVARRFRSAVMVALSTGCVYPFAAVESSGCAEDVEPAPPGAYAQSCRGRELAFEKVSLETGAPVVLIRLNYSVEFRYGVLTDIALNILQGEDVDVSTGWVNVIWQRDAVDQIILSSQIAASPALPLNITGSPAVSVRGLAEGFGSLLQKPVEIVGSEAGSAWLNDASKSHTLFGSPAVNTNSMMEWIAAWLLGGGATHGKPTKFETRDGKF